MSQDEIIETAKRVFVDVCGPGFAPTTHDLRAALLALTKDGYRILPPGALDPVTLEAAAKVAAERAREWLVGQPMETRRDAPPDIAAAIRALPHKDKGDG